MPRHLRIRQIVATDQPGAHCVHSICGLNPDGTHWTLTRDQAISQIEHGLSSFYIERAGGKRFDIMIGFDPRAIKYLKTIPNRDQSNELLFLPNCVHLAHRDTLGVGA